jgi:hypothetical protein
MKSMRAFSAVSLSLALGGIGCATGVDDGSPTVASDDDSGSPADSAIHLDSGTDTGTSVDTAVGADTRDTGTEYDSSIPDTGDLADTGDLTDTGDFADTGAADTKTDTKTDTKFDAGTDTTPVIDAPPGDAASTCVAHGFAGALAVFDFTGATGTEPTLSATSSAGLTTSVIKRSTALTATAGADSMNSTGWGLTSTADKTAYLTFTVTPATGCALGFVSLAVDVKSSTTGPSKGAVGTSADSFTSLGTFAGDGTATVSISTVTEATGAVEVRIYGYGATSSAGTMRVQNKLTLYGWID